MSFLLGTASRHGGTGRNDRLRHDDYPAGRRCRDSVCKRTKEAEYSASADERRPRPFTRRKKARPKKDNAA
ncbi:hypothetical protein LGM63_01655 [Burkholderia cepacia]|uniref:hypothetical protein n=1 Tax=Burkholderia cepacia TaxID=292 RepID=UPI000398BA6C|nr:hypothetical protein [Burkholderia cepacia]ERJ33106.1 hypothetical protein L810_4936 [Burkholderia sp. AU4i]MBH9682966.1 hypothetical protein [Burkholderia cepacia]MBH9713405.1 hypothetical protein [Burkholderia cepacia]MBH9734209.1 hypothetical protein [Burkholderia cepacia]MCA7989348.1 hypothetical protein [Burkholderia cepacia]